MSNQGYCSYFVNKTVKTSIPSPIFNQFNVKPDAIDLKYHPARCDVQVFFSLNGERLNEGLVEKGFPPEEQFYIAYALLDDGDTDGDGKNIELTILRCALRTVEGETGRYHLETGIVFQDEDPGSEQVQRNQLWKKMAEIAVQTAKTHAATVAKS